MPFEKEEQACDLEADCRAGLSSIGSLPEDSYLVSVSAGVPFTAQPLWAIMEGGR